MITRILTLGVYVSDQDRALAFFTETLGFELRADHPMGPNARWLKVASKGAQTRIVLNPRSMMDDWETRQPSLVFGCDDVETTHTKLSAKGVPFSKPPQKMAWGKFAIFEDPDGNSFVLKEND